MNILLSDKENAELAKLVLRWARKKGHVSAGEQLVIQLAKKRIDPVVILPMVEKAPSLSSDEIDRVLAQPIGSLGLSTRTKGPLEKLGIVTVGIIARWQYLSIRGLGPKSRSEVKCLLEALGIVQGKKYPIGRTEREVFLDLFLTDFASRLYLEFMVSKHEDRTWALCQFVCKMEGLRWRDIGPKKEEIAKGFAGAFARREVKFGFESVAETLEAVSALFTRLEIP